MKTVLIITILLIVMIVVVIGCRSRRSSNVKADPQIYIDMRNRIFTITPDSIGLKVQPDEPWAVVMDFAIDNNSATLVSVADGAVSLYLSSGGGWIGCGQHENVHNVSTIFLNTAKNFLDQCSKTDNFAISLSPNSARFYILTNKGVYCSEAIDQDLLIDEKHTFSKLFILANDVITQIRLIPEK